MLVDNLNQFPFLQNLKLLELNILFYFFSNYVVI